MVGIYIGIACLAMLLFAVFVDNLPEDLVDKKASVAKEVTRISSFVKALIFQMLSKLSITALTWHWLDGTQLTKSYD